MLSGALFLDELKKDRLYRCKKIFQMFFKKGTASHEGAEDKFICRFFSDTSISMRTEEIIETYSVVELAGLFTQKLKDFERLQSGPRELKESVLARIELDLIESLLDQRTTKQKS